MAFGRPILLIGIGINRRPGRQDLPDTLQPVAGHCGVTRPGRRIARIIRSPDQRHIQQAKRERGQKQQPFRFR